MGENYTVVVTPQAENSLKAIVNVAEKVRFGLVEEIRNLVEKPQELEKVLI